MSNFLTLSELVQKVITNLSMYEGTATQKYAEDRIGMTILQIFNSLFDDRYWDHLCHWYKYNLTGIDGVCSEDVSKDIAKFEDICCIVPEINKNYKLKRLNNSTNPYLIEGNSPGYYIHSKIDKKIFSVVPFNATGVVYVYAKSRPSEYLPDTVVPFDPDVLIYGTCYQYCADDGNSQSQIQKFEKLYNNRLQQLTAMNNYGTFDWNDEEANYALTNWR